MSRENVTRVRDDRIAELEMALRSLVEHDTSMAGPRAHCLGCECGGTNDGVHSCRSLRKAFKVARDVLDAG